MNIVDIVNYIHFDVLTLKRNGPRLVKENYMYLRPTIHSEMRMIAFQETW
jgi:hypothetical protein